MVRPEGLEPPTLGSEVRCSIQLSYGRARLFQTLRRMPCQGRCNGTGSYRYDSDTSEELTPV